MTLDLKNLSFSRQILPVIAVFGLLFAVLFITFGLPDRVLSEPAREPARAPASLANKPRVAGSGIVEPSSELIQIGSALSGLVMRLSVQPGERVGRGQVLFVVDDRAARAQLREAEAAIASARAGIAEAESARATAGRQLALYRSVSDPAAVSRAEVIRAEGDASAASERLQLARAQLQSAQARAASARTEIDRLTVRAPSAGEILAVNIREGEFVSTMGGGNAPAFIEMGQTQPLHVRIDIDEEQAPNVALGKPATVSPRGAAERQVQATFVRAEPLVVPKRSLTNSAAERVDVRVLQVIYALAGVQRAVPRGPAGRCLTFRRRAAASDATRTPFRRERAGAGRVRRLAAAEIGHPGPRAADELLLCSRGFRQPVIGRPAADWRPRIRQPDGAGAGIVPYTRRGGCPDRTGPRRSRPGRGRAAAGVWRKRWGDRHAHQSFAVFLLATARHLHRYGAGLLVPPT